MARNQHLLRIVNNARTHFSGMSSDIWHMTEEQYVAHHQEMELTGEEDYQSPEYYRWMYMLYRHYHYYAPELIQKELCPYIHDCTLREETVNRHFRRFNRIRTYVGSVYDAQEPYYQTRVAELSVLWILMDLSSAGIIRTQDAMALSSHSCLSLSGLEPLVAYVFHGMDFLRSVYAYTDTMLPDCKKLSDHPLFREVSFTVEQILKGKDEDAYDGEIRAYLDTVFTMWQIHDRPVSLRKAMKRLLLVNYKYLCSRGVELSDETLELFRDFLAACG